MLQRLVPKHLDMQIALVCAIVLLCSMPWYIIHEANVEFDNILNNIEMQSKVISTNIATSSTHFITTNNISAIERLLKNSIVFPDITSIQVINNQGFVLSEENRNNEQTVNLDLNKTIIIPLNDTQDIIIDNNNIVVWSPINNGELLGWVKLSYSLKSINDHRDQRINNYIRDGSLVSLILILLLIYAMRQPLRMISEAANFSSRLESRSGEQIPLKHQSIEIDKLYQALNKASASLAEQEVTIKKIVSNLKTQKLALEEHSIVSISDINGIINYVNQKLLDSTGYKTEELIGHKHSILKSDVHSDQFFKILWDTVQQGKIWHGDIVNYTKQKLTIWMQTTIVPFLDDNNQVYEYVTIQTDITALKNTEAQLVEKNIKLQDLTNELENKVKSRTSELQKVNAELIHLNNTKSDFVSVVSHELRTPLTSIKSFAEILEDDIDELDSETRHHYISIINEESVRLGELINNILDLQKIDSGKMTWYRDETNLKKLASTSVELFSKLYQEKGITLNLEMSEDELIANVDSDKIKQVLSNLLSNAFKFTDQGTVTLSLIKIIAHPTALILDDDDKSQIIIQKLLDKMKVKIISCTQVNDAFKILKDRKQKIDLIITDVDMLKMDGIEHIKLIRNINKELPIMIVSSKQNNIILKSLLNYVVTAFIDKEVDPVEFNSAIKKIFGDLKKNKNEKMVEISLQDTGTGIPEEELDKVFERFHQVDNSETREKGGSGLGLPICQDIVEQHDGVLWVKSTYGKGSCFSFNLPLIDNKKKPIGEILVEAGVATQEEINHALSKQK